MSGDLMPMESAGRVLAELGRDLVEDMSQPAAHAGFAASLLTSALLARARMGFIPTIVIALMVGVSVEHLYGMAEDIHDALTLGGQVQLLFHGIVGCQGHDPCEPFPEECADAAKPV